MTSPLTPRATSFENWSQTQRWFDWQNESAETCPARGMIQLKPFTIDDTEDPESFFMDGSKPVWYGTMPNVYGQELQNPALLAFNGLGAVAPGKRGLATMHPLCQGPWVHGNTLGPAANVRPDQVDAGFWGLTNPWIPNYHGKSHRQVVAGAIGNTMTTIRGGRLRYNNASAVRVRQQKDPNYHCFMVTNRDLNTSIQSLEVLSGASLIGSGYWSAFSGVRFGVVPGDADSTINGVVTLDELLPHKNNAGAETGDPFSDPTSRGLYLRDGGIYHGVARLDCDVINAVLAGVFVNLSMTLTYDSGSGPVDTAFAARFGGLEDEYDDSGANPGDSVKTRFLPRQLGLPFLLQIQPNSWLNFRVDYQTTDPDKLWGYEFSLQLRWQSQPLPRYADA